MKSRAIAVLSMLIVMAAHLPASADPFALPELPEREMKESRVYLVGRPFNFSTASRSQRLQYLESPNYLKADLQWIGQGPGRMLKFVMVEFLNNKDTASTTFIFKGGPLELEKYEKIITNASGKRIRREYYNLAHPYTGYPDDMLHPYAVEVAFRGMPLDKPGSRHAFHLWVPPNLIVPVEARVRGVETINLESGARSCYRVDLFPDLATFVGPIVGRILQPLIPEYSFWFETAGTHPIVRYRGPLGKINISGAPTEVYDLVKVDPDPAKR